MFRAETQLNGTNLFTELWESTIKRSIIPEGQRQLTNDQLVEYITRKITIILRDFPFRERLNLSADVKDNAKSIALRLKGNEHMHPTSLDRLSKAAEYYNESITYATKGSEERAIAYANRSVVCLQLCLYKDCLENIRLARESNYPGRLVGKLNKREAIAKDALLRLTSETDNLGEVVEELKLSYKCHAHVPQMVNCLELRRNEEFGRHVVTNRQLNAGDVLLIEKPFACMPCGYYCFSVCAYCFVFNAHTLIPCEGCTVTMYCSEKCLSKAHQQFHRYECAVLRDVWRIRGYMNRGILGLRTVAKAIALCENDLEAMMEHVDGLDESKVNAFTIGSRTTTQKDVYNTVHVLSTNQALRSRKDLTFQIFCATIIHQLMLERTELGTTCATNAKTSKFLYELILRHLQTSQVNGRALEFLTPAKIGFFPCKLGYGIFSLISMFNHSCLPNVTRVPLMDGRCAVVALSPITAGEQLFDSYSFYANQHVTPERLKILKELYQFTCRCDACELGIDDDQNDGEVNIGRRIANLKTNAEKVSELISYLNAAGRCFPPCKLSESQIMLKCLLGCMNGCMQMRQRMLKIN